jgi:hypothetical protein
MSRPSRREDAKIAQGGAKQNPGFQFPINEAVPEGRCEINKKEPYL